MHIATKQLSYSIATTNMIRRLSNALMVVHQRAHSRNYLGLVHALVYKLNSYAKFVYCPAFQPINDVHT